MTIQSILGRPIFNRVIYLKWPVAGRANNRQRDVIVPRVIRVCLAPKMTNCGDCFTRK